MLKKCKILNCDVEIDAEKTAQWYAQAEDWGCECGDCVRFVELAKDNLLPDQVKACLELLKIPASKATYVCLIDGKRLYQFSYRIAGDILTDDYESAPWDGIGHCCYESYPYGAPDFPTPHFDIEFWAELP